MQACDAISGARPGARREILESYLKRIGELEELALSHDGVQKAYAMQAGRELRVIVEAEKVSDQYADDLSFMISQKIQNEMQYPGQIKSAVIREKAGCFVCKIMLQARQVLKTCRTFSFPYDFFSTSSAIQSQPSC